MDTILYALLNKKIKNIEGVPDEKIIEAVNNYLDENPVQPVDTATVQEINDYLGIQ